MGKMPMPRGGRRQFIRRPDTHGESNHVPTEQMANLA
jgi:hypothetical protein